MSERSTVATFPDLANKVAVVTGGGRGIGAATSRALATNGARVAVLSVTDPTTVAAELRNAGYDALSIRVDCTNLAELEAAQQEITESLGPPELLAMFAGGFRSRTPVLEISEEEWRFVIDSNLTATFLTAKAFLPAMRDRRCGAVVTMASNAARHLDIPLTASYAAAKAGVVMFTRHVAKEMGPHGIRVNCVAPATTLTQRIADLYDEAMLAELRALSPLGELGLPEDVAGAALFLLSDASRWVTGITLDVAGGRVMV